MCRWQVGAVCFDLNFAFDLVLLLTLLIIFSVIGLFDGFASWFCSCLTNRQSFIRISEIIASLFVVLSGDPQGFVLGPLLFNIFINVLCIVKFSSYIPFVDNVIIN